MTKLNNYIVLSIAEKSYELFKGTNYSTFPNYCRKIGISINSNSLSPTERIWVYNIFEEIGLIYGISGAESWEFIKYFFTLDVKDLSEYYKYVKSMEVFNLQMFMEN